MIRMIYAVVTDILNTLIMMIMFIVLNIGDITDTIVQLIRSKKSHTFLAYNRILISLN